MPIREYIVRDGEKGCPHCSRRFEILERFDQEPLKVCPQCGAPIQRCISTVGINTAQTNLDDRARSAGFTKLKRIGHGEYEKQY